MAGEKNVKIGVVNVVHRKMKDVTNVVNKKSDEKDKNVGWEKNRFLGQVSTLRLWVDRNWSIDT